MNPSIKSIVPIAAACALALAACGGGGGSGAKPATSNLSDEERIRRIRTLTGSTAPAETNEEINARVAGILERTDSFEMSGLHTEIDHPGDRDPPFLVDPPFSVDVCRIYPPEGACSTAVGFDGAQKAIRIPALEVGSSTKDEIRLTRNGITLGESGGTGDGYMWEAYGAWMRHAFSGVRSARGQPAIDGTSYNFSSRWSVAGGDLTGSLPTDVSATWSGVMVGTPATGAAAGNVLQGDAALTYTLEGGRRTLDAAFTDIKDLDRLAAHTTETVRFDDVPVGTDGTFRRSSTGNYIKGGFYGPGHIEAAGVFEQSNILGAFGATKNDR